jgi:hypothetical protein
MAAARMSPMMTVSRCTSDLLRSMSRFLPAGCDRLRGCEIRRCGLFVVAVGCITALWLQAQPYRSGWIDTVYAFHPGTGQNFGQDSAYFPRNIFGPPDSSARPDRPSASPEQICSLGLGGEIIVGFKGMLLRDGPGPDFVIFENAFFSPITGKVFAEPALVAVSRDGEQWLEFPWDTLTLEGCAGRTPTNGAADPLDPTSAGGDWFDLALLGVDSIRYIRIRDLTWWLKERPWHPFWDPTLSGFDLDAVGARFLQPISSSTVVPEKEDVPQASRVLVASCVRVEQLGVGIGTPYRLYSLDGRLLESGTLLQELCPAAPLTLLVVGEQQMLLLQVP